MCQVEVTAKFEKAKFDKGLRNYESIWEQYQKWMENRTPEEMTNQIVSESPFLQRMMAKHKAENSRRDDWIRCDGWGRFIFDYGDHMDKFGDTKLKGVKADWLEHEGMSKIQGHMHEDWTMKKVAYTRAADSGWNYKKGWGFHKDGHGPDDGAEPPGVWLAEDINILSRTVNAPCAMVGNKLESYIIALSYSVPDGIWPDEVVNACRYWFVRYGEKLSCEWNTFRDKWTWRYSGDGTYKAILTKSNLEMQLRTAADHYVLGDQASFLAGRMLEALENGKMFDEYVIDDLYQEEEEQETMRGLYEVFIVNINDTDDIDVTQVVADSDDKAKMKAWAEMEVAPDVGISPDVDDYDFFTVKIGGVRDGCCKGDSCKK